MPLRIGGSEILVELAKTSVQRAQGLSNRKELPENSGMLFVFEKPDYYSFWMKDMNFAIDIIWIDENKKIVDITDAVHPRTYPKTFQPRLPVWYVLEVNSGWANLRGVEIGAIVEF